MNLSEEDIEQCQRAFNDLDDRGEGEIMTDDLEVALETVGLKQKPHKVHKLISEIDDGNNGRIKFKEFLGLYARLKYAGLQDDDQDMIDAFVAMGGNEDKTGNIDAEKLIRIIKNEFELTIDIEGLIKEVDTDGSGVIEFGEFKELLKTNYLQDDENEYP
ncbi:unnamed protein product [Paramecium sonneborni]|uniref:Calmodulin n=1 Tax=Paramecium sonneborni TaxID=65129 RepID=A0A8S1M2U0_9CILI|nr:unnamed protein product [Paramecium sonneborni]